MKYGESTFDVLYLLFAIVCGIMILRRTNSRSGKLMGAAALTLGDWGTLFISYPVSSTTSWMQTSLRPWASESSSPPSP